MVKTAGRRGRPLAAALFLLVLAACQEGPNNKHSSSPGDPPRAGTASAAGCSGTYTGSDPMEIYQWYLTNGGMSDDKAFASGSITKDQDINFGTTAQTGCGVKVAIVDEGMELAHEDLAPNVVPGASVDFTTSPITNDPTNPSPYGDHGTSVAGLIAMRGGNGIGGRGVAAEASIVGYNFLQNPSNSNELISLGGASYTSDTFIFNQSYGLTNTTPLTIAQVNPDAEAQYQYGVTTLRGGKGAIYVKAAGNGFQGYSNWTCGSALLTCQNANMDPYNTLPYQIVVGAVNADGVKSSYSTAGSAIWVSAPGGEFGANVDTVFCFSCSPELWKPAMLTTDQSGCSNGYSVDFFDVDDRFTVNRFILGQAGGNTSCNYTTGFNGTSSAAPIVSGVAALLLQVNPALTWRDVKYILAMTATNDQDTTGLAMVTSDVSINGYVAEPTWQNTGETGVRFHNWYGFGRVNVTEALARASSHTPLGPQQERPFLSQPEQVTNGSIPNNDTNGISDTITISNSGISKIEAVQVKVKISHSYPAEVQIELTREDVTGKSVLLNAGNGFASNSFSNSELILLTNFFFGHSGDGKWTLKVLDLGNGNMMGGTLASWDIRILGH